MIKTYSIKHIPGKSETTVPQSLFVTFDKQMLIKTYRVGRWSSDYGFFTEVARLEGKTFFCEGKEVCIIDTDGLRKWNTTSSVDKSYSMPEWTIAIVKRNVKYNYSKEIFDHVEETDEVFIEFLYGGNFLPKSNKKLYLTIDDYNAAKQKADDKAKEKRRKNNELFANTNNGPMAFKTDSRVVMAINKKTDKCNANVGDEIYGVIQVLNEDGKSKIPVASKYVSYVTVYLNGVAVNTLPMSVFAEMMATNFVLK